MTLLDKLNEDMKNAMKAKDKPRLSVIRMVKASLQNEAIKIGVKSLAADDELTVLSREMKQRTDSMKEFKAAGRDDLCEKLAIEIDILEDYLPSQLTEEALISIVQETIEAVNATSKKDFGMVMGQVMPKVKGRADGSKVQKVVQSQLS